MAKATTISNAAAIAACDAQTALLDGGAGPALIRIYDGSKPANPDVAITTQQLLAELTCSDPAFDPAVDGDPGGRGVARPIADDTSAAANGTASWFRAVDSNGTGIIDGTVGTSDADMILNTVNIVVGAVVSVSSWVYTMRES